MSSSVVCRILHANIVTVKYMAFALPLLVVFVAHTVVLLNFLDYIIIVSFSRYQLFLISSSASYWVFLALLFMSSVFCTSHDHHQLAIFFHKMIILPSLYSLGLLFTWFHLFISDTGSTRIGRYTKHCWYDCICEFCYLMTIYFSRWNPCVYFSFSFLIYVIICVVQTLSCYCVTVEVFQGFAINDFSHLKKS